MAHNLVQKLTSEFNQAAKDNNNIASQGSDYLGSSPSIPLKAAIRHGIVRKILPKIDKLSPEEQVEILNQLVNCERYEEKVSIGTILSSRSKIRKLITPAHINEWLNHLNGWAEIDNLCQGIFLPEEILANWAEWKKYLLKWSLDTNISKRRASLVLLTMPISKNPDPKLLEVALQNINQLTLEKNILITKAISWLMRDMISFHRAEVESLLVKMANQLPKIAIRETKRKLETGRK